MTSKEYVDNFRIKAIQTAKERMETLRSSGVQVPASAMPRLIDEIKEEMILEAIQQLQGVKSVKRTTRNTK